jgi:hypothetical protein
MAAIIAALSGLYAQNIVTKTYKLNKITSISAGYTYDIKVTKGNSDKVVISAPERYAKYIKVSFSSGFLKLYFDESFRNRRFTRNYNDEKISVTLEMSRIDYLDLSGAARFSSNDTFFSNELKLDVSGAASIHPLNISGNSLKLDLSGASNATLNGDFGMIKGELSGAASVILNVNSKDTDLEISGAANLKYNGDVKHNLTLDNSGASRSTVNGNGTRVIISCSGASNANTRNFKANDVNVEVSGASNASVYSAKSLTVETSGCSKITYYGNPDNIYDKSDNKTIINGDRIK